MNSLQIKGTDLLIKLMMKRGASLILCVLVTSSRHVWAGVFSALLRISDVGFGVLALEACGFAVNVWGCGFVIRSRLHSLDNKSRYSFCSAPGSRVLLGTQFMAGLGAIAIVQ